MRSLAQNSLQERKAVAASERANFELASEWVSQRTSDDDDNNNEDEDNSFARSLESSSLVSCVRV